MTATLARPTKQEAGATVARWHAEPDYFIENVLGATLYDKQRQVARACATNRRVSCVGCNGSGKDFLTGRLVLWWLASCYPSKVIVLAPTHRQVQDIVWRETRAAFNKARIDWGGKITPREARIEFGDEHFGIGFATDEPYNILGHHSPHLMVIISEAHGMAQEHIDAAKRLNPHLLVMTGNPFTLSGEFYDSHHSARELWRTISISAFDTPNVQQQREVIPGLVTWADVEERRKEWGETNPLYQAGILGQFPDSLDDVIVPLSLATAAVNKGLEPGKPNVLGLDVSRMGSDKSVLVHRRGPKITIPFKLIGRDLMELTGRVKAYYDDWNSRERRKEADAHRNHEVYKADLITTVVVDDVGVGGGVSDRLRELGVHVYRFQGGGSPSPRGEQRYVNATSEAWMLMAEAFKAGALDIPKDDALISQVATRRYEIQSDRRIKIESKEDLRPDDRWARTLWHSPDEADALAMTFAPKATSTGVPIHFVDVTVKEEDA